MLWNCGCFRTPTLKRFRIGTMVRVSFFPRRFAELKSSARSLNVVLKWWVWRLFTVSRVVLPGLQENTKLRWVRAIRGTQKKAAAATQNNLDTDWQGSWDHELERCHWRTCTRAWLAVEISPQLNAPRSSHARRVENKGKAEWIYIDVLFSFYLN